MESHWYLAVINAKRKEIQILDSIGPKDRTALLDIVSFLYLDTTLLFLQLKNTYDSFMYYKNS
jgi:Ulp1 family protease